MTDPQRVYVTGGAMSLDDLGCLPLAAASMLITAILCSGNRVADAIDRNTAAMEAPACVPAETKSWPEVAAEPLKLPAVLENR